MSLQFAASAEHYHMIRYSVEADGGAIFLSDGTSRAGTPLFGLALGVLSALVRRMRETQVTRRRRVVPLVCALAVLGLAMGRPATAATGTQSIAATGVDDPTVGTGQWTDPGNAQTNDNAHATAVLTNNDVSRYLKCTGFGFSVIP